MRALETSVGLTRFRVWLRERASARQKAARPVILWLSLLGLVLGGALCMVFPVFRFPRPGGPHAIGTRTYAWVDAERLERFSADTTDRRELVVQIWYPAQPDPDAPRAAYIEDAGVIGPALARLFRMPGFFFGNLGRVSTHAHPGAPLAPEPDRFPVLLFLEGLGGFRQMNTFQVEALVSHGYIVVALDQPYTAAAVVFPDGRQIDMPPLDVVRPLVRQSYLPVDPAPSLNGTAYPDGIVSYLAQDVVFVLDQLAALDRADPDGFLTGRLDLQHVGAFGISLGGIVVGEACRLEPRIRACVIIDAALSVAVVQSGLQQPCLWVSRPAESMRLERERFGGWAEPEIEAHLASMRAVFANLPGDGYIVQIPGLFHLNPTDVPLWSPLLPVLGATGPIDATRAHQIVNAYSLAFFDRYLRRQPASLLDGSAAPFDEVIVERTTHTP